MLKAWNPQDVLYFPSILWFPPMLMLDVIFQCKHTCCMQVDINIMLLSEDGIIRTRIYQHKTGLNNIYISVVLNLCERNHFYVLDMWEIPSVC